MSYLIILVVIALALAPVLALKPSRRQRLQAHLRDRARELGLQVQVCTLPQTHRQEVRREDSQTGVVYRLLWRHPEGKYRQFTWLLHRLETEPDKTPPGILQAMRAALEQLPEAVLAVEFTNSGVAVYWDEAGDEQTVAAIAEQLNTLRDTLDRTPLDKELSE